MDVEEDEAVTEITNGKKQKYSIVKPATNILSNKLIL
jgi:hypothetical protein